jgi:Zn-dependent protease with chaperone function
MLINMTYSLNKEFILPKKSLISLLVTMHLLSLSAAQAGETAPEAAPSISDIYSDVDMRVRLAIKPDVAPCVAESCSFNQEFDARVQQLGAQLSASAYAVYPAIKKRVKQFTFGVVDKKDAGTASNGAGKVVLFRGLQQLELSDDALSFVIAREMGHIIGDHHATNTYTKLIISVLASVAFPALAIVGVSSAAAQATTATTLLTSAASTATSVVGSEVALARMKPTQLAESDEIALNLMNHQGWDLHSAASVLQFDDDLDSTSPQNGWMQDLQISDVQLQRMVVNEELAIVLLEDGNLVAEAAPITDTAHIADAEPTAKIGLTIEEFDSTTDLNDAEQNLPIDEIVAEPEIEPAIETSADVIVEAIQAQ